MPSRFEGWNIAAIEAAASSKATLGTRIQGLNDSIKENETGLLVPPEDVDALAEKMALLLSDPALRKKLGKNGYAWAQNFTWEKVAKIQEEFYLEVIKTRNK
jgi:glycosyltransferase involved in cell wall biosynthesis